MPNGDGNVDYDALAKQYGATSSAAAQPASGIDYDALAKQAGAVSSTGASVSAQPAWNTWAGVKSRLYEGADVLSQSLPGAGAMIGGAIGAGAGTGAVPGVGTAVGAVGGAGIGGMAGEAGKQILRNLLGFETPQTTSQQATDIAKEGAIQAGIQTATEALPMAAAPLRRAAETQYLRALAPTGKNKVIAGKIVPEMMERGVRGSLPGMAERASSEAAAVRPELTAAYSAMPATAGTGAGSRIIADLDAMKSRYIVNGQVVKPEAINAIEGVQDIVRRQGQNITPNDLRQLKSVFDEAPAVAGAYSGADLATKYSLKVQKAAANSIRDIVHSASPDVAALDKEINFWLNVQKVTSASALRQTGQAGGLVKVFTPLAAAGTGAATGYQFGAHAGLESAGAVVLAGLATKIVRSTAWRTASAVTKDAFADALASGNVGAVAALATRFGVAAAEGKVMPAQAAPTTQP